MKVLEAGENYLETILIEQQQHGKVRSVDVANALGYSRPTVCVVMKQFREDDYIEIDEAGYITLTGKGREIAERMYERHTIIAEMLVALGVDEETALTDSCKIEHDLSERSFHCIKEYYQRLTKD
jgi:Mn-dependent DtxR family transcriptional regulator